MHSLPLTKRPIDIVLIIFFCVNLFFITYIVDLEQLVIADANHFQYPVWPPSKMVDVVHWYGNNFDPLLIARPAWWRATIWIDALFFGPFYVFAIYAYAKGKNWIRFASIVWASVVLTNVSIILFDGGVCHTTPDPCIIVKCCLGHFPFDRHVSNVAIAIPIFLISIQVINNYDVQRKIRSYGN